MADLANTLDAFWMPFTANRQFKKAPRMMVSAAGMHYTSDDGRKILDGAAGLWCVNAGHCRKEIAEAIAREAERLDYSPAFQIGCQAIRISTVELIEMLDDRRIGDIQIFHTENSGTRAADSVVQNNRVLAALLSGRLHQGPQPDLHSFVFLLTPKR